MVVPPTHDRFENGKHINGHYQECCDDIYVDLLVVLLCEVVCDFVKVGVEFEDSVGGCIDDGVYVHFDIFADGHDVLATVFFLF